MKTCFFIGHRSAPDEIRERLAEAVEQHITEYGVTDFTVGHYGQFDALAAGAVKAAKKKGPRRRRGPFFPLCRYSNWEA